MRAAPLLGPHVQLVRTAKQLARALASIGVYPKHRQAPKWSDAASSAGMTWTLDVDGEPHWIVGIMPAKDRNPIDIVALIVHEAVHVKQGYMAYLAEHKPSDEFEAYTMQAITQQLLVQYGKP